MISLYILLSPCIYRAYPPYRAISVFLYVSDIIVLLLVVYHCHVSYRRCYILHVRHANMVLSALTFACCRYYIHITYNHVASSIANGLKCSHRYCSFVAIMTFVCGPITIDVLARRHWHPDGGLLVQTDKGNWKGDLRLPIGKIHVRIASGMSQILTNPFSDTITRSMWPMDSVVRPKS